MRIIRTLLIACTTSVALLGCGSEVVASEELKSLKASELASLYCNAMKRADLEQLKQLINNQNRWEEFRSIYFSNEKEIEKHKVKAEKYDCAIVKTKERESYTKFYFRQFRTVYVYHENGKNLLKL